MGSIFISFYCYTFHFLLFCNNIGETQCSQVRKGNDHNNVKIGDDFLRHGTMERRTAVGDEQKWKSPKPRKGKSTRFERRKSLNTKNKYPIICEKDTLRDGRNDRRTFRLELTR